MCLEALESFLPARPEPIRIDRFIEKRFKCPLVYEPLPPGILGCTAFNKDGSVKAVFISAEIDDGQVSSERRIRSTIAHEAGHCLMHGSLFLESDSSQLLSSVTKTSANIDFHQRKILCRPADIGPVRSQKAYAGQWWEWQANRAIGSFLLPQNLVRSLIDPMLSRSFVTGSPTLPQAARGQAEKLLAKTFEVNPVVARIRLSEMFPPQHGQMEF